MSSYRHHLPAMGPYLFRFGWATVSNLTNSFVLSAHCVEKRMQNTSVNYLTISVTSGDFARNHSDLNRMFLPVTYRVGPKSLPGSLDSPAFFHGGTHSGF